ncbi:MAG: YihA family ribosome biogenesis GTP-binding protein [Chitinophagales bacterium]|mgnify:FL=1|nr:YihA family ribosome biogenesis GTP-binding protein [Chitinophagales bacterium]HPW86202.1 ribosome biogenesis GTP-binding protein YihA/YsxC [Chitinophagales bacterium]HQO30998.1 ribosome biogenesis GTP-binding protein YihA/YsxC [Chitinophagales bacterium]HQO90558.1 ribosome biogenesis GTP-binding protein YihA/YsxC [Chitinophagales bacterium]
MIHLAKFIGSFPKTDDCPDTKLPEFAFIGRSNVGKSSLINLLTHRKDLAKVSQTPGKTQNINLFLIDESWHLVDLPGYGYARVSKTTREVFDKMIRYYITKRPQLSLLFVLVDGSISPQKIDLDFIDWLGEHQVPFAIVFTKTDKEKNLQVQKNIRQFKQKMLEKWEALPEMFVTSAEKNRGGRELLDYIKLCSTTMAEESQEEPEV